MIIFSLFCLIK